MIDLLVILGNVACWGTVVLVWIGGAIYNAVSVPPARIRGPKISPTLVAAFVASAFVSLVGAGFLQDHAAVGADWVRILGLMVLVASSSFALWARFALGTLWSVAPRVGGDGSLRTSGPYAVTRHPIYTGLLGMLLGTALLGGMGRWIVPFAIGVVVFPAKIQMEERLLLATFPQDYSDYRQQVPQLIPRLRSTRSGRSLGGNGR